MFEKSLADLIQGLRANKRNEAEYIQRSLEEVQREVQQSDMRCKSAAVDKLNYLHMLGYDMNWASFNVVEVMASPRFGEKRTGYLAAAQSFHAETAVLMLTTNLMRKDLASANAAEVGVALDGLAQIATAELARDLFDDVLAALGHARPYIRKKAVVCLYRLALKYPDGLHALAAQLKERLDDPDPSVVSAAVSVVCELARTNPHNYLPLAPKLYHLLTTLTNNWILIKIVNLFAWLTPIEPRLARKLHGPLSRLVSTTSAMSLLYECVHTAIVGDVIGVPLPVTDSIGREIDFAELCAQKLELFYESRDHNLRYVGLVTLARLQERRPDLVAGHYETVLACLDDPDLSIRMRALKVMTGMATRRTLVGTVKRLMSQLLLSNTVALQPAGATPGGTRNAMQYDSAPSGLPQTDASGASLVSAQGALVSPSTAGATGSDAADNPEYRLAAVEAIIAMCSHKSYENMTDSEWYVATLADLVYVAGVDVDRLLSERLLDATVRVRQVRQFSTQMARRLLSDAQLVSRAAADGANARTLGAAAYILGEYCPLLPADRGDVALLLPTGLAGFADDQQATCLQAAMKAYANWLRDVSGYWSTDIWEQVRSTTASTQRTLSRVFLPTADTASGLAVLASGLPLQVSSRLRQFADILKAVSVATSNPGDSAPPLCTELHSMFTMYELNPVSAAAQAKVPVPEGLDLEAYIGDRIPDTSQQVIPPPPPPQSLLPGPAALARRRESHHGSGEGGPSAHRSHDNEPFYLGRGAPGSTHIRTGLPDVDDIPVVALELGVGPDLQQASSHRADKKGKKSRRKPRKSRPRSPSPAPVDIAGDEDMPGPPAPAAGQPDAADDP